MKYYMSTYFMLFNGVKQGGVLTARRSTAYVDSLLDQLKHSVYGGYITAVFMCTLSYDMSMILLYYVPV